MSTFTFSCNKCHHNFTANAVEGTKIKCRECNNEMNVPVYDGLRLLNNLGFEMRGEAEAEDEYNTDPAFVITKNLVKIFKKPLRKGIHKIQRYINFDKMVINRLESWELYCNCPNCKAKYITNNKYENLMGLCHNCDIEFTIEAVQLGKIIEEKKNACC